MTATGSSRSILIKGGRVIDPASRFDASGDVFISGGRVAAVETKPGRLSERDADEVIDAEGLIVAPGLIDPHVHLREPDERGAHEETVASGAAAAINGGFTTVCVMPNTRPPLDNPELVRFVHERAAEADMARVFVVACATKDRAGGELSPILLNHGGTDGRKRDTIDSLRGSVAPWFNHVAGFSDDGDVVADPQVMADALRACRDANRCFMQHCQEPSLTRGASMNAGPVAERLGQVGWPKVAEELIVQRDIDLNRDIGAHYHAQHLSSGESAAIIRRARADRQPVSSEVSPHHLLLTDGACEKYGTMAKMNPPLRTRADINLLKEAVADGTITILATDHAPHPLTTKTVEFAKASFGIVGLDCALPLYGKALLEDGVIDWTRMLAMMTVEPARLTGLDRYGLGLLAVGGPADVTIIDPRLPWRIDVNEFCSAGRNCPFNGWDVRGRAVVVIVGGRIRLSRLAGQSRSLG